MCLSLQNWRGSTELFLTVDNSVDTVAHLGNNFLLFAIVTFEMYDKKPFCEFLLLCYAFGLNSDRTM